MEIRDYLPQITPRLSFFSHLHNFTVIHLFYRFVDYVFSVFSQHVSVDNLPEMADGYKSPSEWMTEMNTPDYVLNAHFEGTVNLTGGGLKDHIESSAYHLHWNYVLVLMKWSIIINTSCPKNEGGGEDMLRNWFANCFLYITLFLW